ncbi:phospholipase A-2-activating protein [Anopheles arabiensis]|uniref:Phospholipase A-2-activating protein n=1 Tax=Anopheles arabiensis TaxID=7173 RepID=A0A182IBL1_ANOAR|nr:phospholipase A-2-activating protein [Anopheles arabiensis]
MVKIEDFKLSCELAGHKLDVRAVTEGAGFIVSGSRDKTAKVWQAVGNNRYEDVQTLTSHTNYVGAVLVVESNGWVCTGSNDATICIFQYPGGLGSGTTSAEPIGVLKGHTSTVCALAAGHNATTLISGSWDKTAKIWTNAPGSNTNLTLVGHEAAVWAVACLPSGRYLSGSADKNIFVWNERGEKLAVLKGHKDCVRGLCPLPKGGFLSCSNDATVRHWSDTYECVKEFHGHSNYIYSIGRSDAWGEEVFVTGGEDSTIRMWHLRDGALGDALQMPAQSVWAVAGLKNGDMVAGTSDAIVRVFTMNAERAASEEALAAYRVAVEVRQSESAKQLGGMNVNDLPGPESLLSEGRDGQTRIVRHPNGKILCYQWTNGKWDCVGDVMGASDGDKGKQLYEGREYDYVFSVNLSDDAPNLKLPYNRGEDPWFVAQRFIHKHNLPQAYLDQVANFIVKNSDSAPVQSALANSYYDPFTGGSRYVPGSSGGQFQPTAANTDPFTGGSSYTTQTPNVAMAPNAGGAAAAAANGGSGGNLDPFTGGSSYTTGSTEVKKSNTHFPHRHYILLENADLSKVLVKLKELNSKLEDQSLRMSDDTLNDIVRYAGEVMTCGEQNSACLTALKFLYTTWPTEKLFPIMDITRLIVREPRACQELFEDASFMGTFLQHTNHLPANQLMSARCFTNMLAHQPGRNVVVEHIRAIVDRFAVLRGSACSPNLQIALASFYLNLTMTQLDKLSSVDFCKVLAGTIAELLCWLTDNEATYRGYQALGNLLSMPGPGMGAIADTLKGNSALTDKILFNISSELPNFGKLNECASYLYELLV